MSCSPWQCVTEFFKDEFLSSPVELLFYISNHSQLTRCLQLQISNLSNIGDCFVIYFSHYPAHPVMEEANSSNHIINLKSRYFRSIVVSSSLSQWHNPECAHMPLYVQRVQGLFPLFCLTKRFPGGRGSWALMWRQVVHTKYKLKATALFHWPDNFWGWYLETHHPWTSLCLEQGSDKL